VERKRYPSISRREVDGFRKELNPSYGLAEKKERAYDNASRSV
jgi:hypothetical protein